MGGLLSWGICGCGNANTTKTNGNYTDSLGAKAHPSPLNSLRKPTPLSEAPGEMGRRTVGLVEIQAP